MNDELARRRTVDEIARLQYRVDQLESVKGELDKLRMELLLRIDELDERHDTHVRDAAERTSEVAEDIAAIRSNVQDLAAEMDRQFRATLLSAGAPRANFDTIDDSETELVARVNAADKRRASFTEPRYARAQENAVEEMRTLEWRYKNESDSFHDLCQKVLDANASDRAYIDRDQEFERVAARVEALARKVRHQRPKAEEADRALAADQQRRAAAEDELLKGDAALTELKQNCRARLEDALASGAVLPFWFTSALRHAPPLGKAEEWLSVAVDVLVFRLRYGVTDRSLALGSRSASGAAPPPARTTLENRVSALYR